MTEHFETLAEVCARVDAPRGYSSEQVASASRAACCNEVDWKIEAAMAHRDIYDRKEFMLRKAVAARNAILKVWAL